MNFNKTQGINSQVKGKNPKLKGKTQPSGSSFSARGTKGCLNKKWPSLGAANNHTL